jgi:adenosylcobinamide-GDP ribazoletransferase
MVLLMFVMVWADEEKILMIMKTALYGYDWFNLLLLLKYQGLTQLIAVPENPTFIIYNSQFTIFCFFFLGHIGRLAAISIVFTHQYVDAR